MPPSRPPGKKFMPGGSGVANERRQVRRRAERGLLPVFHEKTI
jgi:hypothetical protein